MSLITLAPAGRVKGKGGDSQWCMVVRDRGARDPGQELPECDAVGAPETSHSRHCLSGIHPELFTQYLLVGGRRCIRIATVCFSVLADIVLIKQSKMFTPWPCGVAVPCSRPRKPGAQCLSVASLHAAGVSEPHRAPEEPHHGLYGFGYFCRNKSGSTAGTKPGIPNNHWRKSG